VEEEEGSERGGIGKVWRDKGEEEDREGGVGPRGGK
jgi:hypothetical protein